MKDKTQANKKQLPQHLCPLPCDAHNFSLQPQSRGLYFSQQCSLNCCPQYNKKQKKFLNVWPELNLDGKPHMPTFALEVDMESIRKKEKEYKDAQEERINHALDPKEEILVPHPGKNRHTCFVCRSTYNDYLTHVLTKTHKNKLRASPVEVSIHHLVAQVGKEYSSELALAKEKKRADGSRQNKKEKKEQKHRLREKEREEQLQSEIDDFLKHMQPTQPSLNKNEEERTLVQFFSNVQSFRVSDYLL